jgi:hypothetical protein
MRTIAFFCFVNLYLSATAQIDTNKRIFQASRIKAEAPVIDGVLDDNAWKAVKWVGNFTQQVPNEGAAPTKPTAVKIIYDNDNLYVAIFCYDDPAKILSTFCQRDEFSGDATGIALDSYYNKKTAYEFNVTAAGQKIDIMHTGDGNIDFNWNAIWDVKTFIGDSGWAAEYRIPFSQLRYNHQTDYTWGMHIWRWLDRNKEESQWQLIPINAPAGVHNFGILEGISNIRESRQAELMPYVLMKYDYNGSNDNPYINYGKFSPNAGIDAKIGISSNFTLDATINPDFGQVEADPAELNLSAYETYFEEKRPFFLEGNEIFDFNVRGNSMFYSRRIGATPQYYPDVADDDYYTHQSNTTILGSGKLTGRTRNGFSVGVLETVTASEFGKLYHHIDNPMPGSDTVEEDKILIEPLTNYFASRIKKESKSTNTVIGGTFNSVIRNLDTPEIKDELVRSAHTAGIDFEQFINKKNYYIKASSMFSYLEGSENAVQEKQESHIHRFQRPDAKYLKYDTTRTSLSGTGGYVEVGKRGGKFRFGSNASYWSPGLNLNDIGFLAEADYIEQQNWLRIIDTEQKKYFRSYSAEIYYTNRWSFGGEHTRNSLTGNLYFQLKNLWDVIFIGERFFPSLDTRTLRGGPAVYSTGYQGGGIVVQTNSAKRIYGRIEAFHDWNKAKSSYDYFAGSITATPIDKLKLSATGNYEIKHFNYEYFEADFEPDVNKYLMAWLDQKTIGFTIRAEYYLRPEISIQYYGNPMFSVVNYSKYMLITNAEAADPAKRVHTYAEGTEIKLDKATNWYSVNDSYSNKFTFENPDFSYVEFRSNLVFRWEYKLGSVIYLVWSHQQGDNNKIDSPQLNNTVNGLFDIPANDIIMGKFSYWFNL